MIVSPDSVVDKATGYGIDDRGVAVRVPVGWGIFSSPRRPNRFWGPPTLLSNGYRGLFPRGKSGRGVKLTIHLQLVPRSRKCGSIHPLPHTPSCRSAQLVKHRDNFTFISYIIVQQRRTCYFIRILPQTNDIEFCTLISCVCKQV
jgi:hypothetical protein